MLGAHPDDEMGCAGTIHGLVREGWEVGLVTFSKCRDLNDQVTMEEEWHKAIEVLGMSYTHSALYDYPNRHLPEYRQSILEHLDARRGSYDRVFVPASWDSHQDHQTVTREAARCFKTTTVLGYELTYNTIGPANLSMFTTLSMADMGAKQAHAAVYRSQSGKPYMSAEFIRSLAVVRGIQSHQRHAEAFEVIRWV